jgi:hypothetical protein
MSDGYEVGAAMEMRREREKDTGREGRGRWW